MEKAQIEPSLQEQLKAEGGTGATPEALVAIAKSAGFEINVEDVKRRRRSQAFVDKVQIDPSLQEQLEGVADSEEAIEVAKGAGFEINVEDVVAYLTENTVLTDEELEMVSGGGFFEGGPWWLLGWKPRNRRGGFSGDEMNGEIFSSGVYGSYGFGGTRLGGRKGSWGLRI